MKFSEFITENKQYKDFDAWKEAIKKAYPFYASKMQFKGRVEKGHDTISAEVPGLDRSFGIWTGDEEDGQGEILGEALTAKKLKPDELDPSKEIKVGQKVRSYDFPGMHDNHYIEGEVVGTTSSTYKIKTTKVVRDGKEIKVSPMMANVEAPKGRGSFTGHYAVHALKEALDKKMPLIGHEYHTKTTAELNYIIKDAGNAAKAMKGHDPKAEAKYLDQMNDASTVLYYRQKGGKQLPKHSIAEARSGGPLKVGERVKILLKYQDAGDDKFEWYVVTPEEKGRLDIGPKRSTDLKSVHLVQSNMVERF